MSTPTMGNAISTPTDISIVRLIFESMTRWLMSSALASMILVSNALAIQSATSMLAVKARMPCAMSNTDRRCLPMWNAYFEKCQNFRQQTGYIKRKADPDRPADKQLPGVQPLLARKYPTQHIDGDANQRERE